MLQMDNMSLSVLPENLASIQIAWEACLYLDKLKIRVYFRSTFLVDFKVLVFTSMLAAEGALVLQKSICCSSSHKPANTKIVGFFCLQYVLTDEALIYIVHLCCCKFMLHYTTICFASVRESCSNPNTSSSFIDMCCVFDCILFAHTLKGYVLISCFKWVY